MAELFMAGAVGFILGGLITFAWLRRLVRISERAYQLATSEMRALYEQRTAGAARPQAPSTEPSGETMAQREEVCAAWADLPAALTAHPAMKRLYRALGGISPRGVPPSFKCQSTTADGRSCRGWCGDAKCTPGVIVGREGQQ